MNPALLAALITQLAIPELAAWLKSRHEAGLLVDDAAAQAKLGVDADTGIAIGSAWLTGHPRPM